MPVIERISIEADMLGESPVWDARQGCLFWVDGVSRLVRRYDPSIGVRRQWSTPSTVGSIGLTERDGVIVAAFVDGVWEFDLESREVRPLFRPEPGDPRVRFNDGKVARDGAFVVGSMGLHADPLGRFYRIAPHGSAECFASGIRISNSVCFSPDGRTIYFADSLSGSILQAEYGRGGGPIGPARPFADTSAHGSGPDGATVDTDGCVWVAMVQAGRIARFTPKGALDRMIDAPVDIPSSVAFGGPDMRTLFVTSIKDSGSGRAVSRHPEGGHLFAIDGLGAQGIPEPRFGTRPDRLTS